MPNEFTLAEQPLFRGRYSSTSSAARRHRFHRKLFKKNSAEETRRVPTTSLHSLFASPAKRIKGLVWTALSTNLIIWSIVSSQHQRDDHFTDNIIRYKASGNSAGCRQLIIGHCLIRIDRITCMRKKAFPSKVHHSLRRSIESARWSCMDDLQNQSNRCRSMLRKINKLPLEKRTKEKLRKSFDQIVQQWEIVKLLYD